MTMPKAELINYKEFLKKSEERAVRANIWKWQDIDKKLKEVSKDDPLSDGRWAVSLVHEDTGKAYGVCPSLNMLVQVFEPGKHAKRHRHSNFAIFIVRQGSGYSIIDDQKIEWQAGDVFFAPPWAQHEHCNTSQTEQAVLYTVQDVPSVTDMGVWFFQGSEGEGFQHRVTERNE
jgi:gentisate 1,2-dioxygenase